MDNIINESKNEMSELIRKMIYHSLEINACKTLSLKYENLIEPTKILLGEESTGISSKLVGIRFKFKAKSIRHEQALKPLAEQLLKLSNLSTIFNTKEIIPFGTTDIERGYVELMPANERWNVKAKQPISYVILLNQGDIISNIDERFKLSISNAHSELSKGYLILYK